jgi:hypothetical protein
MRSRNNDRRLWRAWAATMLAVTMLLTGSLVTQAQPPEPTAEYAVYLPLVAGDGVATSPIDPVPVRFIDDVGRASHAAIGPEGGTLSATAADGTRFELLIPPEALDFTEVITMTPVLRAENLPLSGGLVGAVNLEPAGLDLYAPAVLRIIPLTLAPDLLTIGFAYNGTGEQFHLRPIAPSASAAQLQAAEIAITIEIVSIRPVGTGRGSQADIDQQQAQPAPADPVDAMEQQIVDEVVDPLQQRELDYLYRTFVLPRLQRALNNDQLTDTAIIHFEVWLFWVDKYGMRPHFNDQVTEGKSLIGSIIPRASAAAAERCFSQKRPEEGFRLLRWMRYARKYLGSAQVAAIEAKLAKCLRFELTFHSHITEGGFGNPYGYLYDLEAQVTLRATVGTRATGTGPLVWKEAYWIGRKDACITSVDVVGSTLDAQRSPFGLSMTPVSRTSPAVNMTLRYDPGVPTEQASISCPRTPIIEMDQTTAWSTYFGQIHAVERDVAGYRVTSQVVGAGSFPGWTYTHLTTSGPDGQAVIEDTEIKLVHAPER